MPRRDARSLTQSAFAQVRRHFWESTNSHNNSTLITPVYCIARPVKTPDNSFLIRAFKTFSLPINNVYISERCMRTVAALLSSGIGYPAHSPAWKEERP